MDPTETTRLKVALATLGCKVNQAESESLAREFAGTGSELVDFDGPADVYVLNSCTVTHIADRKSRQLVRQARRHNPDALVVVTGCYAEIEGEDIAPSLGADLVVGNAEKSDLIALVRHRLGQRLIPSGERIESSPLRVIIPNSGVGAGFPGRGGDAPRRVLQRRIAPTPKTEQIPLRPGAEAAAHANSLLGTSSSTLHPPPSTLHPTFRTRAMVKVQDGCNSFCSYCIVPVARGRERSVAPEVVVAEVRDRVDAGYKEIVLTGVHAGAYGRGLPDHLTLARLVGRILRETSVQRLRLSSIEPWDLDQELLDFVGDSRFCRHFHLPLQSGSESVLKRMGRRYGAAQFASSVDQVRAVDPDVAITTDVIVGFPGETGEEFAESIQFCREMGFARMHVFRYSPRRGTRAAKMTEQLDERAKRARSEEMMQLADESATRFRRRFVGRTVMVLWEHLRPGERAEEMVWSGLTDNYLRVDALARDDIGNHLLPVRIVGQSGEDLWGEFVELPSETRRVGGLQVAAARR